MQLPNYIIAHVMHCHCIQWQEPCQWEFRGEGIRVMLWNDSCVCKLLNSYLNIALRKEFGNTINKGFTEVVLNILGYHEYHTCKGQEPKTQRRQGSCIYMWTQPIEHSIITLLAWHFLPLSWW